MKRRITKLFTLYLLLGLVATVAVAWGSAWRLSPNDLVRQFHDVDGPPYRSASEWRCWGGRIYILEDALDSEMLEQERQSLSGSWMEFDVEWPAVASSLIAYDEGGVASPVAFVEARGWPWIAVRCELEITPEEWSWLSPANGDGYWLNLAWQRNALVNRLGPPDLLFRGAIEGPDIRGRFYSPTGTILLPYLPYWPGLIADTLVFAAAFAGLHQVVGFVRRSMRRKPGMCTKCGYDLTGIEGVCPECGTNRAAPSSDTCADQGSE